MTAFGLSDKPDGALLDLTTPELSSQLADLEERLHLVRGLLDALARMNEVNKVVQFSRNRNFALVALEHAPFGYSHAQAEAVLDMPVSWQASDEVERLRAEHDQLVDRRSNLHEHVTEVLALHWFG
jgi:DNA gyrase/topoisomerase IV subunit A